MKNTCIIILSILTIGFVSCKKNNTTPFNAAQQAINDDATIKTYISSHNIDSVIKDTSGIYYKILTKGTGAHPTAASTVTVNYEGALTDGTVFAPTSNLTDPLPDLITGWQIGVPFINTGGTIMLFLPSRYGYGNSSPGAPIPANAVLIFTIQLVSFTN